MKVLLSYGLTDNWYDWFLEVQQWQHHHLSDYVAKFDRFVTVERSSGDPNISRMRNRCMEEAIRGGYDWVILADIDCLFYSDWTLFPGTGAGFLWWKREKPGVAWPMSFPGHEGHSPCSIMTLHRDVFSKFRFCEDFEGHGYEDTDFINNVLAPEGIHFKTTDLHCAHLWHPTRWAPSRRHQNQGKYFERIS